MLSPIPRKILRDTMTLHVPVSIDRYQQPVFEDYVVNNVHIQSDNTTKKNADNTEVTMTGIVFVDGRISTPQLDYEALQNAAHAAGSQMTCEITNRRGAISKTYTIHIINGLPDDEDNLHHWELGVV